MEENANKIEYFSVCNILIMRTGKVYQIVNKKITNKASKNDKIIE